MLKKFIFIILSGFMFNPAFAMNFGDLHSICNGTTQESKTACKFFIMGYAQGVSLPTNRKPCLPENYPFSKIEDSVKNAMSALLSQYPSDSKLEASGVLGGILVSLYKCPNT